MKHDINLVIRSERRRFDLSSATGVLLGSLSTVVLAILVSITGYWNLSSLRHDNAELAARYQQLTTSYAQMKAALDARPKNRELQHEVDRLEYLLSVRHRVQELLQAGSFGNTTGFSDYFVALAQKRMPGLWITGIDIRGSSNDITMTGSVHEPDLVPLFMKRMSSATVLSGTEFNVLRMARADSEKGGKKGIVDFSLTTRSADTASVKTVSVQGGTQPAR